MCRASAEKYGFIQRERLMLRLEPGKAAMRDHHGRMATVLVLGILNASSSSGYDRSMNEILRILGEFESVGQLVCIVAEAIANAEARKSAETALAENDTNYRSFLEKIPDIVKLSATPKVAFCSRIWRRLGLWATPKKICQI